MKALALLLLSLLGASMLNAQEPKRPLYDFTDVVQQLRTTPKGIDVVFRQHAAVYHLLKSHPKFEKLKAELEKLRNSLDPASVEADPFNQAIFTISKK